MAKRKPVKEKPFPRGGVGQYPNTMLVGDSVWSIKFVRDIEGSDAYGACDPQCKTIYIEMGQTRYQTLCTFLHELIHAIEIEYGFTIRHSILNKLELALASLLTENNVALHRIMFGD